jgi:predicted nucleic acid-binding protein
MRRPLLIAGRSRAGAPDDGPAGTAARAALASDSDWAAPAHLIVEVVSAIRGKTLGGKLPAGRAEEAVAILPMLAIDHVDISGLVARMWQLRANLTAYDAAYLAAAEALRCPLVTADARLACVPADCEIRLSSGLDGGHTSTVRADQTGCKPGTSDPDHGTSASAAARSRGAAWFSARLRIETFR